MNRKNQDSNLPLGVNVVPIAHQPCNVRCHIKWPSWMCKPDIDRFSDKFCLKFFDVKIKVDAMADDKIVAVVVHLDNNITIIPGKDGNYIS